MTTTPSTTTNPTRVRLRYMLRDSVAWSIPVAARPVVFVTMEADGEDERGVPQFDGPAASVAHVRGSLGELRSSGFLGLLLSELPTPRNMAGVMMRQFIRERYEPEQVGGLQLFVPAEQALSEALGRWSAVAAALLTDTLPHLPSYKVQALRSLIERIDMLAVLGRGIVDDLLLPSDALAQVAASVWQALAAAGKDADWLAATVQQSDAMLAVSVLRAPQRAEQAAAVVGHIVGALARPQRTTLPDLVAQIERDWAATTPVAP